MGLQNWMTIRVSSHDILIMVEYKLKTNLWLGTSSTCINQLKVFTLSSNYELSLVWKNYWLLLKYDF